MQRPTHRLALLATLLAPTILAACPDTAGGFSRFVKRSEPYRIKLPELSCSGPVDFSGHYLFGAAAVIGRDKPLRFDATITIEQDQSPWGVDWSMRALAVADGAPVGDVIHATGTLDADGVLFIDFGAVDVPGSADPILPNVAVTTTLIVTGCSESATFACGPFDGALSKPTVLPLAGSTWALVPIPDGQTANDVTLVAACPGDGEVEGGPESMPEVVPESAAETTETVP